MACFKLMGIIYYLQYHNIVSDEFQQSQIRQVITASLHLADTLVTFPISQFVPILDGKCNSEGEVAFFSTKS